MESINFSKILVNTLIISACCFGAKAQVKVGSNPTTINANANLQVEATDATQVIITKDKGNVGIGTVAPTSKLHVIGDGSFQNTSSDYSFSKFESAGGVITQIGSSSPASLFEAGAFMGTTTNNPINFLVNNNPVVKLTNTSLLPNGSNLVSLGGSLNTRWKNGYILNVKSDSVGIGTDAPASRLEVKGDGSIPQVIVSTPNSDIVDNYGTLYRNSSAGAYFGYVGNLGGTLAKQSATIIAGENKSIAFKVNGVANDANNAVNANPQFFMSGLPGSLGYVGLGTTNPKNFLHIVEATTTSNISASFVRGVTITGKGGGGFTGPGFYLENVDNPAGKKLFKINYTSNGGTEAFVNFQAVSDNAGTALGDEILTITHGRRVGMGTSAPSGRLEVKNELNATIPQIVVSTADNAIGDNYGTLYRNSGAGAYVGYVGNLGGSGLSQSAAIVAGGNKSIAFKVNGVSNNMNDAANANPNLFINGISAADGNVGYIGVGTTTPSRQIQVVPGSGMLFGNTFTTGNLFEGNASNGGVEIKGESDGGYISAQRNGNGPSLYLGKRTGGNGDALAAWYFNGSEIGSLRLVGTTGVSYNTTSDMRLKTNIKATNNGINTVLKMNAVDYTYKSDKTNTLQTGFLAQELYKIFPQAVYVGGADEKTNPWSVDYSKLTPVLVKAIQEQQAMIEALKSKLMEFNDLKAEMASIKSLLSNVEASKASK